LRYTTEQAKTASANVMERIKNTRQEEE